MKYQSTEKRRAFNWDKFGIGATVLCAIHCLALPLILPFLAAMKLGFVSTPAFEGIMVILAISIGLYSVGSGYLKSHRQWYPLLILGLGILILLASNATGLDHDIEHIMIAIGSLGIVVAHLLNWRLCQSCPSCVAKKV